MIHFSNIASVYNEYLDNLYSYALHLGFDEQTAMDAIHDVFYKLCLHHSSPNEILNLKFYLFRSLRNRLIDICRIKNGNLDSLSRQDVRPEFLPFQLRVSVEDELIMKEDAEEIRRKIEKVLAQLTDRQREIIYLRYIQECSYEEISAIMLISIAACRNLISKSLKKLKGAALLVLVMIG